MSADTAVRSLTERPTYAGDLDHWCCCTDEDVSLCGFDLSESPFGKFDMASCTVCEEIAEETDCCPFSGRVCSVNGGHA